MLYLSSKEHLQYTSSARTEVGLSSYKELILISFSVKSQMHCGNSVCYLYSSPPQLRYPQLHYFQGSKKLKLSYFPPSYIIIPPCYAIFFFFPPLRSLLCFRRKNSVTGGKNTNTDL